MTTKRWMRAATSCVALAALAMPGMAWAGKKVKLPPGDNSNFWERWKPAVAESMFASTGPADVHADAASSAVVVDLPIACGTNWNDMYLVPGDCPKDAIAALRLGKPYGTIAPVLVASTSGGPGAQTVRFSIPVTQLAMSIKASEGGRVTLPAIPWTVTPDAQNARDIVRTPPDWADPTTVRVERGWWHAEGAIPRPNQYPPRGLREVVTLPQHADSWLVHVATGDGGWKEEQVYSKQNAPIELLREKFPGIVLGDSPPSSSTWNLPNAPGALVRLGRSRKDMLDLLSRAGGALTFTSRESTMRERIMSERLGWEKGAERGPPAGTPFVRVACGPFDPGLEANPTRRLLAAHLTIEHPPVEECSTVLLEQLLGVSGQPFWPVSYEKEDQRRPTHTYVDQSTLMVYGSRRLGSYERSFIPYLKVSSVGPTIALADPIETSRADLDVDARAKVLEAERKFLSAREKRWFAVTTQFSSLYDAYFSAPSGLISDADVYMPWDSDWMSMATELSYAAQTPYLPVGFAMPIPPEAWSSIVSTSNKSPATVDVSAVFKEATQ